MIKKVLPLHCTGDHINEIIFLKKKLNEIIDTVNILIPTKTPNIGGTPEVDNTEGQVNGYTQVKYETTFHNDLPTARNFPEKIITCTIFIPNSIMDDFYAVTKYIETNTNHFALDIHRINKPVETTKEQPIRIWKLHCKNKDNNYKASLEMFQGNPLELSLHITNINSKNYSYFIVDFEEVC